MKSNKEKKVFFVVLMTSERGEVSDSPTKCVGMRPPTPTTAVLSPY